MQTICEAIYGGAKRQVDYLRYGTKTRVEEDLGKHIRTLVPLQLTEQQLTELEAAFRQVQEHLIGSLFALVDGSRQPPGWPNEIRLVNFDTGAVICPGGLEWAFGLALAQYRASIEGGVPTSPSR
jgi:hypothetical protein